MIHLCLSDILKLKRLPLGELGFFYSGLSGKSKEDFEDGNGRFIPYMNVFSNYSVNLNDLGGVKIGEGEHQNKVEYGDILFTGSSETPDECGMSSVMLDKATDETPIYLNSFCFGFRFNDLSQIYPAFYKHLFRSTTIRKEISKTANGVTRFNIAKKLFAKILIPLPSKVQQKEIADKLDMFTTLISGLDEEIEIRKIQFEFYSDNLLFNKESNYLLDEFVKLSKDRISVSEINDANYVSVENLLKNKAGRKDTSLLPTGGNCIGYKEGDVLVGNIRPYLRKIWFADRVGGTNGDVVVARVKDEKLMSGKFLFYVLSSERFFEYYSNFMKDGKMPRGDKNKFLDFPFCYITREEQDAVVKKLDVFTSLITKLQEERDLRQKQYEYYREKLLTFE